MIEVQRQNLLRDLGSAIKHRRQLYGMLAKDLALTAGVSGAYISQIENGAREPTIATLVAIASALEISVPALFLETLTEEERLAYIAPIVGKKVGYVVENLLTAQLTLTP